MRSQSLGLSMLIGNLVGAVQRSNEDRNYYDVVKEERLQEFEKKLSGKGRLTRKQIAEITGRNLQAVGQLMMGYVKEGKAVEYIMGSGRRTSQREYEWVPEE